MLFLISEMLADSMEKTAQVFTVSETKPVSQTSRQTVDETIGEVPSALEHYTHDKNTRQQLIDAMIRLNYDQEQIDQLLVKWDAGMDIVVQDQKQFR